MADPQTLSNGRYLLVKRLGEGGMATVYRGFDQRLQVWRAVKVLLPEYARKKKIMARFETEAQTMAMLEHPNIVRVYDVDREGDFPYIVMELVEGGCLVDWLEKNGPMPPRMAVDCIVESCTALQFAHDRQIIHRDIKPHNIMIDRKGVCRLTDFGIARAGDADDSLTKTGAVMGTWGFMAPEQRTDAKHVDGRADVYAMAATLYSLITDATPMDLFLAGRETSMLEGIPEVLIPVLVHATEYRKEDRHDSARAFAAALLAIRGDLPENPEGTPPLVGEVTPLPPPPSAPEQDRPPSSEPPPKRTAPQAQSQPQGTLMPSDTRLGSNPSLTAAPEDPAGFDLSGSHQQPVETWQEAGTVGAGGNDNSMALVAVGALLIALFAVGILGFVALNGMGVTPSPPPESAPTPVEAAPPPPEDAASTPGSEGAEDAPSGSSGTAEPTAKPAPKPTPAADPEPASPAVAAPKPQAAPTPPPEPEPVPVAQRFTRVRVPASVEMGGKVPVRAETTRETTVILHYRAKDGTNWFTKSMANFQGARSTTIEVRPEFRGGIEYYLSSDGVTWGSARQPKFVKVTSGDGDASP